MADADKRDPRLQQAPVKPLLVPFIHRAGRLVEEGDLRFVQQDPGEGNPLLLAERKDVRPILGQPEIALHPVEYLGEIYLVQRLDDEPVVRSFLTPGIDQLLAQGSLHHVGALREEDQAVDIRAFDGPLSALPEAGDRPQQRALAGPALAHDQDALAGREREV